jgi:hypothetical protein
MIAMLYCTDSYSKDIKFPPPEKSGSHLLQHDSLTVVKQIKPSHLTGDFNGDGNDDDVYIVHARGSVSQLASEMKIIDLYEGEMLSKHFNLDPKKISLALLHSNKDDMAFLIYDTNQISVLDGLFSMELMVTKKAEASELEAEYGIHPVGDVIVIPTQAGIDTYLFWNGSSYQYYFPNEIP